MKEVEKKEIPEVSGGFIEGEITPAIDLDYPGNPGGPIVGPTCPPFPRPEELTY